MACNKHKYAKHVRTNCAENKKNKTLSVFSRLAALPDDDDDEEEVNKKEKDKNDNKTTETQEATETETEAIRSDDSGVISIDAEALEGAWMSASASPSTVFKRTSAREPWPSSTVCVGASILPFAVDPQHDRVYFWLCKNRRVLTWGAGSRRWSDFGGVKSKNDIDAAATAAREFWEETAGCVRYFETDTAQTRKGYADIAASLRNNDYVLRFETALDLGLYVTFVVQVPWDPRAARRFEHCRLLLSGLTKRLLRRPLEDAEVDAWGSCGPQDGADKNTASKTPSKTGSQRAREQWLLRHPAVRFSMRPVPMSLCFVTDADKTNSAEKSEIDNLEREKTERDTTERDATDNDNRNNGNKNWVAETKRDKTGARTGTGTGTETETETEAGAEAVETQTNTQTNTQTETETAIETTETTETVVLPVIESVCAGFLEKEAIDLWSVPALVRALRYDGILGHRDSYVESLRPSFTPIVSAVLAELMDTFPAHFCCDGGRDAAMQFPIAHF